jgi:hypothetical protein
MRGVAQPAVSKALDKASAKTHRRPLQAGSLELALDFMV